MGLKTIVDDLEEINEQNRDLYEEQDGKYVLSIDDVDTHPGVRALKNAYEQEQVKRKRASKDRDTLKTRLAPLLDQDPELDLTQVEQDRLERAFKIFKGEDDSGDGDKGHKNQVDLEKIKEQARKPIERELEQIRSEEHRWRGIAQRTLIDNELSAELTRAGVKDPDYRDLLLERFRRKARVDADEEEGTVRVLVEGEYGDQKPADYVKEWAGTDYAKKFLAAPENGGGGAVGGGRGSSKVPNPWKKESKNFDEQMRLAREEPERAKRMAAEAGVTLRI